MLFEFRARNELRLNPEDRPTGESRPSAEGQPAQPARLRLCYISNPNSIHTRRWVGWFARRGHTVCLLADVPPKEPWAEVSVIDLSRYFHAPIIRFPVWAAWLRRFIRQWHPDVLHAHRVNSAGWLAAASGFHPYVITPWGSDVLVSPRRSWIARLLASYTLQRADMITTNSQSIGDQVIKLGGRFDQLRSIQFGIEMDIFNQDASNNTERADLLKRLSLPENARVVLSARAITQIYNQDVIMQTIPLVLQRFPQAIFVFRDYNTDPRYKEQLDGISKSLGLEDHLRWLPSTGNRTEMAELYRLSDVIVSVPTSDGTPVSMLEAMACGKAVVASDLASLREFIAPGENGWLVPVRQVLPLAQAIIRLLEESAWAAELGRKAHRLVAERADLDKEMQRMEAIYYMLAGVTKD
jgi:glycosyltransferase involved in cell wall biosynthesis